MHPITSTTGPIHPGSFLPATGYLRQRQLIGKKPSNTDPGVPAIIPISASTLWDWVRSGRFPKPVKLGANTTAWRVEDKQRSSREASNEGCLGGQLQAITNTSSEAQRARLLARLKHGAISTIDARRELNVMHPAMRVKELREAGHRIVTVPVTRYDDQGRKHHRVALYTLMATALTGPGPTHGIPTRFACSAAAQSDADDRLLSWLDSGSDRENCLPSRQPVERITMARARNIKPGFFKNEDLAECDPLARILFAGLWCQADREGRLEDRPKRLKAECLPYDECNADVLMDQLALRGFITRYAVDGLRYIQINEFLKHQNPHQREIPSCIPAKPDAEIDQSGSEHNLGSAEAQPRLDQGHDETWFSPADSPIPFPDSPIPFPDSPIQKKTLAQRAERREAEAVRFEKFWETYPRRVGKQAAQKAFAKVGPDDELLVLMLAAVKRQAESDQWQRDGAPAARFERYRRHAAEGRLMRATEIAQRLSAQVDGVVRLLLPNGKRVGQEWRVGSADGEAGGSLGVHLTGDKAGVWSDFSTGESGDLIGLWMACRKISLRDACTEALAYLGIREDKIDSPQKRFQRPSKEGVLRLHSDHLAWLTTERRISLSAIEAYRLASRNGWIMFPSLREGELIAAKYRKLPKNFRQDSDCEPCLFGWQAIADDARSVIITEGELDAMAWHTYGFPALSVPMGGGGGAKQGWITHEFDRLTVYDTIYLSLDSDEPGQQAEREIAERLGRERCRIVRLPHKDANDCLIREVPATDMAAALRDARTLDPSELKPASDFEDAIWREFNRTDYGLCLPWRKTHDLIRLREGETSIWAGVNGHGKSAVISQVVADLTMAGTRCCVASMEFRTPVWLMRMARQIAGTGNPTEAYIRAIVRALKDQLWAFDVAGAAKAQRILEVFRYARRRYGIDLFVIDNLTKCGFDDDDYTGQKRFVEELSDFARIEATHVAVVAHMRKGPGEDAPAGKMAVKGSGGITDMADTVVEVWRNKPRERALEAQQQYGTPIPERIGHADTYLNVLKQRATGEEPSIALWFDKGSTQFLAAPDHSPRAMLPFSAVPATTSGGGVA
uniref:SF4 helicase domain-containing protein n=1 Tax=Mycena chlorophos TaxID=658473 RepID=A0ABQ0KYS6_MYCCL|nr:predicted protein [Mycena chlorophos]